MIIQTFDKNIFFFQFFNFEIIRLILVENHLLHVNFSVYFLNVASEKIVTFNNNVSRRIESQTHIA